MILSNFSERLEELIFDSKLNKKSIAENVGINATCISHYVLGKRIPTIKSLIKLADYFKCSTDYLLGLEEENNNLTFKKCPPFKEQIKILEKSLNLSSTDIYTKYKIKKSTYYSWLEGKQPPLDNILILAEQLKMRVDYILGRES